MKGGRGGKDRCFDNSSKTERHGGRSRSSGGGGEWFFIFPASSEYPKNLPELNLLNLFSTHTGTARHTAIQHEPRKTERKGRRMEKKPF